VKFRLVNSSEASDFNLLDHHRGSGRQILSFQKIFELLPHFRIIEGILIKVFKSTKYQLKTSSSLKSVLSFSVAEGRIWMRKFQVISPLFTKITQEKDISLIEVGPRLSFDPVKILTESFCGETVYENPLFFHTPQALT
jgi:ribosome biogenesis protein BRX1